MKAKHAKRLPRFEVTRKQTSQSAPSPALFAVVHVAGKQYKVSAGDTIILNRIQADVGRSIALKKVLLVGGRDWTKIGTPLVDDETVEVSATVTEHFRGAKVQVFKKKRRKGYAKRHGHRQEFTKLNILEIGCQP